MKKTKQPLKLFLHGLDDRFIKTMTLFLQGPCNGKAMVVGSSADADIDLFDYDSTASKKLLVSFLETRLQRPVIVLSLHEFVEPRVLYLKKPIKCPELLHVLAETGNFVKEQNNPVVVPESKSPHIEKETYVEKTPDEIDLFNDDLFEFMETAAWGNSPAMTVPDEIQALYNTAIADRDVGYGGVKSVPVDIDVTENSSVITQHDPLETGNNEYHDQDVPILQENIISLREQRQNDEGNSETDVNEDESLSLKTFSRDQEQNKTAKHKTAIRFDETSYHQTVGIVDDIDFNDPVQHIHALYNPKEFFQGYFQSALGIARTKNVPVLLQSPWCQISIFPRTGDVWLDARDNELSVFAAVKLQHKNLTEKIAIKPIDPKSVDIKIGMDKFQSTEAFLWKLACWTSKGRYPQKIDFNQPVYLKHWPNFTRLLVTPHSLRISALLIQGPRTMSNIAEVLGIKPQYVFVFISAGYATGLVGQAKRLTDTLIQPPEIQATKKQGLFSKIMSKLRK